MKLFKLSLIILLIVMNYSLCRAFELDRNDLEHSPLNQEDPIILVTENNVNQLEGIVEIGSGSDENLDDSEGIIEIGSGESDELVDYYQIGYEQAQDDYFSIFPVLAGFLSTVLIILPLVPLSAYIIVSIWKINVPENSLLISDSVSSDEFNRGYKKGIIKKRRSGFLGGALASIAVMAIVFFSLMKSYDDE